MALPRRIEYLLTPDDLIRILCYRNSSWEAGDPPLPRLSRAAADREVNEVLRGTGFESTYFWADEVADTSTVDQIWAWAEETVKRVYPQRTAGERR